MRIKSIHIVLASVMPMILLMAAFNWVGQSYFSNLMKSEQMAPQAFEKIITAEMI